MIPVKEIMNSRSSTFPKGIGPWGDCWNGGGLFLSDSRFWLNNHWYDEASDTIGKLGKKLVQEPGYTAAHQDLWKRDLSSDLPAAYHAWLKQ